MNWKNSRFYVVATIVFILLCLLMLLLMLPRPARAQSGTFENVVSVAYELGAVRLWGQYCTDFTEPYKVRLRIEQGTDINYPNYWITCEVLRGGADDWVHKWGRYCWCDWPALRQVYIWPWSSWIACIDQTQVEN